MSRRVAVRGLIAITARETFERVGLLGLAAALAVVPFLAPRAGIGDRPLLGAFLGSVMVFTAAVLTGSSVIARDLAEGRIGFFLARPLPWWSIWGGKALAALVLTFTTGAIVLGPAAASGDWRFPAAGWWTAILVPGLLALIGGAHALAVAYRGRSGWFAADLAITVTLGWIVAGTFRALLRSGVYAGHVDYAPAALWVVALAVTLASAAQVARGGTDIRRAHRISSLVIWSILVPAVLGYATWGAWVRRPSPADLASIVSAQAAPGTTWITVAGRVHWPRPAFLMTTMMVDPRTGRFLRVAAATSTRGPVFLDGTHAVWIADAWSDTPRLFVADLGSNHPAATRMPLPIPPGPVYALALSPDKRTVAVVQAERSTVFTIGSEQPLVVAPARLPGLRQAPFFSSDGRAHVLVGPNDRTGPGVLDVLVLDPTSRRWTVTGHVPTRGNAIECWGPGAERVVIVQRLDLRPSVTCTTARRGRCWPPSYPKARPYAPRRRSSVTAGSRSSRPAAEPGCASSRATAPRPCRFRSPRASRWSARSKSRRMSWPLSCRTRVRARGRAPPSSTWPRPAWCVWSGGSGPRPRGGSCGTRQGRPIPRISSSTSAARSSGWTSRAASDTWSSAENRHASGRVSARAARPAERASRQGASQPQDHRAESPFAGSVPRIGEWPRSQTIQIPSRRGDLGPLLIAGWPSAASWLTALRLAPPVPWWLVKAHLGFPPLAAFALVCFSRICCRMSCVLCATAWARQASAIPAARTNASTTAQVATCLVHQARLAARRSA
jgi:hypothetical protein